MEGDDAHPADVAASGSTRRRRGAHRGRARRRAWALGARRAAVLRRRGRAVHQRPDDRDRRLLRRGRGTGSSSGSSASGSPTAAGTARPRTGRCGRRSTRRSTCSTGCSEFERATGGSAAVREAAAGGEEYLLERAPVPSARARARSSIRRISTPRSRTTGTTTCCAALDYFRRAGATRIPGWRRPSRWCSPSGSRTGAGCSTSVMLPSTRPISRVQVWVGDPLKGGVS